MLVPYMIISIMGGGTVLAENSGGASGVAGWVPGGGDDLLGLL